ncbi:DUF4246 domain-containing protein [Aspergillus alliaceus]|uniref:DUF4246 domain-containing protein n=1 Tax=Petromyces alliaceus TaxID=209559 RepID=UPI0012A40B82|nr:uncharacterized protein BDW43DRAFT_271438 [Aspergillus alliaceus]KAB8235263.1 hypothetical protein BDW43DRAFT_271438 [Aspergillus alliaceus]
MGLNQSQRLEVPGFNLPLNYRPDREVRYRRLLFPNALDYGDIDYGSVDHLHVHREILMMRVMNTITDKPGWEKKVFDEAITSKWREEIAQSGQDVTPKMMDYIMKELQWKVDAFKKTGMIPVYDTGVVKSDTAVPEEVQRALKEAVAPFEDVPDEQKDYHPGSDMKVVDLIHPSLFPVIYGRTRILPDRTIGLDDCLGSVGQGDLLPVPPEDEAKIEGYSSRAYGWRRWEADTLRPFSRRFQWLPCDVKFSDQDSGCRIDSYINNVHPSQHRDLYHAVEKIIARTIPLWNKTLASTNTRRQHRRISYGDVEYLPYSAPEPEENESTDMHEYYEAHTAWSRSRPVKLPEPGEFTPPETNPDDELDLRKKFHEKGLQVIVKLANIELTPEKPEYDGGAWHVEGQLNERICATAIYYYDSENITESTLAFRQRADRDELSDVSYEQDRHEFIYHVYGFGPEVDTNNDTQVTQDLGSVVCREGRLLTFPNILQHRVSPFVLADRSKPGHRKILALFLVDPHLRVISSANVPPQQENWGKEKRELVTEMLARRLPLELQEMVSEDISYPSISMKEAKEYREQLMEERSARTSEQNHKFEMGSFSLCEH